MLNGVKRLVPFGSIANYFLVVAKTGSDTGLPHIDALMSVLFKPIKIGNIEMENRFVR